MNKLQFIPTAFLAGYEKKTERALAACFKKMKSAALTTDDFKYYIIASSVASSQIEGSTLDLDSFFVAKQNKKNNKEVTEIENLVKAYQYARQYPLTRKGILHCHKLLAANFTNITKSQKGKLRNIQVGIKSFKGLVYLALEPQNVETEMTKLFHDIGILLERKLTLKQTMYYAAWIHFLFAKIHPFADGNGRAARLVEKWFIAQKTGDGAWSIPSEKYYWDNRPEYYNNLNVGVNYYETLDRMQNAQPFILMLQRAVCYNPIY